MARRTATRQAVRIPRRIADAKIKPTTTVRCPDGHEFGLDKDRCATFYGHLPESVKCPIPACPARARLKAVDA